jgi:hypothetical protein
VNNDDRQTSLLEELVAWTRFAHREALVRALDHVLADERHLRAYELTDGTRTQSEVATEAGLSQPSVSGLWQKWRRLGLAHDQGGKTVQLVRPSDIGIERALKLRSRQTTHSTVATDDMQPSQE